MELEGYLYDGQSSARQWVRLAVDDDGEVRLPDGTAVPWLGLSCDAPLGSGPRYLAFPDGRRFETLQHAEIDRLERRFRPAAGRLHRLESGWRRVLLAVALVGLLGILGVRYGLPVLAREVAFALPAGISDSSSRQTLAALDRCCFAPTALSEARQRTLHDLFAELIRAQPAGFDYRLHLRDGGPLGANAFALPSGEILVTDQLVALSPHPDALAGVLAHEIGHVRERHGLRRVLQSSALPLLIIAVTGDLNAASSILAALPTLLVESHYSRRFEREADRFARQQLRAQGRDPAQLAELLRRLEARAGEQGPDLPSWLGSHPDSEERRRRLLAD